MDRKQFVAQFVAQASVAEAMAEKVFDQREALNSSDAGWPEPFYCRFISPNCVINYTDSGLGVIFIQKPVLDAMASSFEGKPIINLVHREVKPENFTKQADGIISDVTFNAEDGWYWARGFIWNEETKKTVRDPAYSVSCSFSLDVLGPKGEHNKVAYDSELLESKYGHMAIVSTPRLEGALIDRTQYTAPPPQVQNTKEENKMTLTKIWKSIKDKLEAKNSVEIDPDKSYRLVDGKKVSLSALKAAHMAEKSDEAARKVAEKEKEGELSEDAVIDVDGQETTVKDMIASYSTRSSREAKNAADEKENQEKKAKEDAENAAKEALNALKTAHENGEHDKLESPGAENCVACADVVDKSKKLEAQNAMKADHAAEKHKETFSDDCDDCKKLGREAFNSLKEKAAKRSDPLPMNVGVPKTMREKSEEATARHTLKVI